MIIVSVVQLRLVLEDRAGGRVDLVVIFHIAGLELDFIDERSVLIACGYYILLTAVF